MKMLKTILRQLFHKPVTTTFPTEPARQYENTRGHIVYDPSKCTSCMICQKRCPSQAIEIERGTRWTVDRFRCVICGQCADLCRFGALSVSPEYAKSATPAERLASGREVYAITYVKPERPKKDAGE